MVAMMKRILQSDNEKPNRHRMSIIEHENGFDVHCGCDYAPAKSFRWTKLRERIFRTLKTAKKPIGAYELIRLLDDGADKKAKTAPITIYRICEALEEAGFIHRLASKNAYVACPEGHHHSRGLIFMLCETCGSWSEVERPALGEILEETLRKQGFHLKSASIEANGTCAACQS